MDLCEFKASWGYIVRPCRRHLSSDTMDSQTFLRFHLANQSLQTRAKRLPLRFWPSTSGILGLGQSASLLPSHPHVHTACCSLCGSSRTLHMKQESGVNILNDVY